MLLVSGRQCFNFAEPLLEGGALLAYPVQGNSAGDFDAVERFLVAGFKNKNNSFCRRSMELLIPICFIAIAGCLNSFSNLRFD